MKIVTSYVSELPNGEGYAFDTAAEALQHEKLTLLAAAMGAPLKPRPGGGYGWEWLSHYVQQDPNTVAMVRRALVAATAGASGVVEEEVEALDDVIQALGGAQGPRELQPLRVLWHRIYSTDELGREYSNPYQKEKAPAQPVEFTHV